MLRTLAVFCFLCNITGCITPLDHKMKEVNPLGWQTSDSVRFEFDISDTVFLHDISLLVRFNDDFARQPLTLNVSVVAVDSIRYGENYTLHLEGEFPKHVEHYEVEVPYRNNVRFSRKGDYVFYLSPESERVKGIQSVGIKIKKTDG